MVADQILAIGGDSGLRAEAIPQVARRKIDAAQEPTQVEEL